MAALRPLCFFRSMARLGGAASYKAIRSYRDVRELGDTLAFTPALSHPMGEGVRRAGEGWLSGISRTAQYMPLIFGFDAHRKLAGARPRACALRPAANGMTTQVSYSE